MYSDCQSVSLSVCLSVKMRAEIEWIRQHSIAAVAICLADMTYYANVICCLEFGSSISHMVWLNNVSVPSPLLLKEYRYVSFLSSTAPPPRDLYRPLYNDNMI